MNYPYAIGTIKVIESQILDKNKLSKIFKNEKGAFIKALIDYGYGHGLITDNLEKLINSELAKVKTYLDEITPDKKMTDLFFLANDCLNIKVLYKIKLFKVANLDYFASVNSIDLEALKKAILEDDLSYLSKDYAKLIKQINHKVKDVVSPRLLSAIIDDSIFDFILQKLKFSFNDTLKTYFTAMIDFANVLSLIRSKKLNWNIDQFEEMYIKNGKISLDKFKEAYPLSNEELSMFFNDYYLEQISMGLKTYFQQNDLNRLERYFDMLLLSTMKQYQYDSFGIGPIIYYYLKKLAEAKNIRLIYASETLDLNELLDY